MLFRSVSQSRYAGCLYILNFCRAYVQHFFSLFVLAFFRRTLTLAYVLCFVLSERYQPSHASRSTRFKPCNSIINKSSILFMRSLRQSSKTLPKYLFIEVCVIGIFLFSVIQIAIALLLKPSRYNLAIAFVIITCCSSVNL